MKNLLNPRNDAVFKMFFSRAKNQPLLISFLEAVLTPKSPIAKITILNPTLQVELLGDKTSVLDLVLELEDSSRIDVEMQVESTAGYRRRILYYWAKLHQSQLQSGDSYLKLAPTICISILDYNEFSEWTDEVHSIFELKERNRNTLYLSDMQLHFLELQKYPTWKKKYQKRHRLLEYWIRFFQANEAPEEDLEELRKEAIMAKALDALEELSQEPSARELADMREKSRINLQIITSETRAEALEQGRAEGKAEGRAEGKAEGLTEGLIKGKAEAQKALIRKAAESGMSAEGIAALFDLPLAEVSSTLKD